VEFSTTVKYKLPIKIIVVRNESLGQCIDFALFAWALGGYGVTGLQTSLIEGAERKAERKKVAPTIAEDKVTEMV
jgi:hypothetical protein